MNKLGTKEETLQLLYQKLKYAKVLPQYTFTVGEWETNSGQIEKEFLAKLGQRGDSEKQFTRRRYKQQFSSG